MAKKKITEYIAEWMMDFGRENGYELSRSEFIKEGESWYLRVFVDKLTQSGYTSMSTEDCEFVSKYISAQLDRFDPITQAYYLEVSSPGLDRPLITDKDFERFKGQMIDIKLYHPLNGQKALQGKLLGLCDGAISVLDEQGNEITVQKEQVGKVSLAVIF